MDLEALETVGDIARHIASTRGDIIGDWTNIELHLDGCLLPEDEPSQHSANFLEEALMGSYCPMMVFYRKLSILMRTFARDT